MTNRGTKNRIITLTQIITMKTIQKLFLYSLLVAFTFACKGGGGGEPEPAIFVGTWRPGTVLLNNAGANLAATGQPYANFQLVLNGDDNGGTYTLSGVPEPFEDANTAGNWTKSGSTIQLASLPSANGFRTLNSAQIVSNQLKFQVSLTDPKTGSLTLFFSLNK